MVRGLWFPWSCFNIMTMVTVTPQSLYICPTDLDNSRHWRAALFTDMSHVSRYVAREWQHCRNKPHREHCAMVLFKNISLMTFITSVWLPWHSQTTKRDKNLEPDESLRSLGTWVKVTATDAVTPVISFTSCLRGDEQKSCKEKQEGKIKRYKMW